MCLPVFGSDFTRTSKMAEDIFQKCREIESKAQDSIRKAKSKAQDMNLSK
jgi:hypothetical protein